jgi:hypothetical protein
MGYDISYDFSMDEKLPRTCSLNVELRTCWLGISQQPNPPMPCPGSLSSRNVVARSAHKVEQPEIKSNFIVRHQPFPHYETIIHLFREADANVRE